MCLFPVTIVPRKKYSYRHDFVYVDPLPQVFSSARVVNLSGEVHDVSLMKSHAVKVKCGKCLQCLAQQSNEWAFRICFEARQYEHNCFITLTYSEENLPSPPSISKRECQLFMKLLRKSLSPLKVRFFCSGEYGSKRGRPHYHFIIFGWFPQDAYFWKVDKSGEKLYRSPALEKIWKKGFSSVGYVSYDSAKYCAKYMQKALFQTFCKRRDLQAPFTLMSNRPGIGYNSVYKSDLLSGGLYLNGKRIPIPRYFLKVMERDGVYLDDFRERRKIQGEIVSQSIDLVKAREEYYSRFYKMKFVFKC